ncbi:MAG: hypothetical protein Q8Q11_03490 [bacterium]|nr:hypothetical protein [bacterium]MDZ4248200.1 hypothetical protein [Patescibacteria group bacterium]
MANRTQAEGEHQRLPESLRRRSLTVGVDLDEVLADLVESVLEHYEEQTGVRHCRDDMRSYNFWDLWGGTREQAVEIVHEFYETDRFRTVAPIPGALEAIESLAGEHELVVVTSRPEATKQETQVWVREHFGESFASIHLTNHFSKDGQTLTKSQVCRDLGVDLMIEDNPEYAADCASHGIPVLLLEAPWNRSAEIPEGVIPVGSWPEIARLLERP